MCCLSGTGLYGFVASNTWQRQLFTHPPTRYCGVSRCYRPALVVVGLPAFSNSSLWPHGVFTWRRSWNFTRTSGLAFIRVCGVQRSRHTGAEQQGRVHHSSNVVVDFEVAQFRDPQRALGSARKAQTSEFPVPVWHPVAPGRRAWMAPGGSHWDLRVGDRHLHFLFVSLTLVHVKMLIVGTPDILTSRWTWLARRLPRHECRQKIKRQKMCSSSPFVTTVRSCTSTLESVELDETVATLHLPHIASVFPRTQCGATCRGDRGMPESSRTRAHPS